MGKTLKPLSGLDAAFLYLESAGTPMHVGSVMLIEVPTRRGYDFHAALLAHIAERLPRAPALRRVLHEAPLDLGHPMWQFVVIENVEPGVVALYSKVHHALLDGQGGVALAQAILDIQPTAPKRGKQAPAAAAATPGL